MLKALELVGFKSFADKTRFEFPRGITTIVGPNGSGKSNVVDAIKWVLGEQSVKSLRGKEMADCIFNGSGSRHALNSAEATLVFDNSSRLLAIEAPEVHVTRRVYRSGEGEYLINRQPCRLRDIRDTFSGTGIATEAYSVIEQGKVDVMLQSSPRDRRVIFEEAAGISRFKAKKIESLRRLERVEQNLLRLSDIVQEVESRLRSVRLQASKARRYQEHADRLQSLRTQVGLADWRKLSSELSALEGQIHALGCERDAAIARAQRLEAESLALEKAQGDTTEAIRAAELRTAEVRQAITAHEASIEHGRARGLETEEEVARHLSQLAAMNVRVGDVEQQLQETVAALAEAETQHDERGRRLAAQEEDLVALSARLDALRDEHERRRAEALETTRAAAALGSEVAALESQVRTAEASRQRGETRLIEFREAAQELSAELAHLRREQQELVDSVDDHSAHWSAAQARLADLSGQHAATLSQLGQLRQRHAGATERAAVLEELQQRQEGLGAGAKEVLARSRQSSDPPEAGFKHVRGVVADLFHVSMEMAPLIEVALGDKAQYLLVDPDQELLNHLQHGSTRFSGRVGFLRQPADSVPAWEPDTDLSGHPGVLGRADQFVDTAASFAPLARWLLGRIWVVETLAVALSLSEGPGRNLAFVTLAGEWLGDDRSLSVGPRHASTGLISRRSELRVLEHQIAQLAAEITAVSAAVDRLDLDIAEAGQRVERLAAEHQRVADALGEHRLKVRAREARHAQLVEQQAAQQAELATIAAQHASGSQALEAAHRRLQTAQARLAEVEAAAAGVSTRISGLERARQLGQREATGAKVEVAKSEERVAGLRARLRQFQEDQQERQRSIADSHQRIAACRERAHQAAREILAAESIVAELYLRKESLSAETTSLLERRERERQARADLLADAQSARVAVRKLDDAQHARQLAASEVRHERTALADRLRDDYGIELAEREEAPAAERLAEREEIDREIAELRRKINHLGNVNLDALTELEELESRHASLAAQFDDLSQAKNSLAEIIDKINADSRRLFTETLQVVRGHFQTLFRKLFGGGQADIVLEEGADTLESGIEIVARPPGKELRSISLLSGGEKTLTCVALLLAIFQYRPSPFCVLDEVDAALDEANIERFIGVLQEFLTWTQFVVVTHSKKTMTCATTLYGVTMQESGVSKRVAVRFEDVSEDGEIRLTGQAAADETQAA